LSDRKHRVLLVSSHPVPNAEPVLRRLASNTELDILVAYCGRPEEHDGHNPEFVTKRAFDTPILNGYRSVFPRNLARSPDLGRFFGLFNPGLARLILASDSCVVFGYAYASLCLAIFIAKLTGKALLLSTDATSIESVNPNWWKLALKRIWLPRLLRIADVVLVPSTAAQRFVAGLGVPIDRVFTTPYVVDNELIASIAIQTDRRKIRTSWGIPEGSRVVLFCGKFIERKRPLDVVRAFARVDLKNAYLVLVGDGPMERRVAEECRLAGVENRIRLTGLVKHSDLPGVYASANVLVVPSDHEPWGLSVNEAMISGIPVIASDRVGSAGDLIENGVTGFVYPVGDVEKLASILRELLDDPGRMMTMGEAARRRMEQWSPEENLQALVRAVKAAIARRSTEQHEIAKTS
jgi:glycosyltransferase involved in cell wall biosynthesis